jgi:Protein of unknown function (DUF3352)
MPGRMKPRSLIAALAAAATIALAVGCGGGSSGSDLAGLAPPGTPVFVEGTLRPEGELKSNVEAIAKQVAGVDLGELIVEELESEAEKDGEPVDFAKEVEPWLGERGGAFFEQLEGEDFTGTGVLLESTDDEAAQEFIDKHDEDVEERVAGLVGDFVVVAENQKVFDEIEAASEGDALADEDTFSKAISAASDGSLADVYVDIGKLIDQNGGKIDPNVRKALRNAGIDPSEATAVASIVPGSEQIAVELSSDLGGQEAPTGDASELLGELPANAFAAVGTSGFGEQLQEAIDSLDEEGVPGTIPPNQLKKGMKQFGIDLEAIAGSLQAGALFASGADESSLGGALVFSTKGDEAEEAMAKVGVLLRRVRIEGVTALSDKYSGFSIRSDQLGDKPLVVAAKQGRLAIGYGVPQTVAGLTSGSGNGKTLADLPAFEDAIASLGDTPISGFADGPGALRLADALIPNSDEGFEKAKKYLKNIAFLALGSATQGELATAKLIIGLK